MGMVKGETIDGMRGTDIYSILKPSGNILDLTYDEGQGFIYKFPFAVQEVFGLSDGFDIAWNKVIQSIFKHYGVSTQQVDDTLQKKLEEAKHFYQHGLKWYSEEDKSIVRFANDLGTPTDLRSEIAQESVKAGNKRFISHVNATNGRLPRYRVRARIGKINHNTSYSYNPHKPGDEDEAFQKALISLKEIKIMQESDTSYDLFSKSLSEKGILGFRIIFKGDRAVLDISRNYGKKKLVREYDIFANGGIEDTMRQAIQELKAFYGVELRDAALARKIHSARKAYTNGPTIQPVLSIESVVGFTSQEVLDSLERGLREALKEWQNPGLYTR